MRVRPGASGLSWRVFSKTRRTRAIWRRAGSPDRPIAGCAISAFLSLPRCGITPVPFAWAILLICIAVFILQNLLGNQPVMIWLAWPCDPSLQLEAWRYFSHAFMHFSLMHILFNLLWWWYLGGAVEKRIGSGKLVVITVISALLSGFVQHQFSGPWFGGLSGVVYALMGYVGCGASAIRRAVLICSAG